MRILINYHWPWLSFKTCFRFITLSVFVLSLTQCSVVLGDKDLIECQVLVDRGRGFTLCQFASIQGYEKDTSKVKVINGVFHGQVIEAPTVSAISIAFSHFDSIPAAVFKGFGRINRFKFYGGSLKTINKETFEFAKDLKYFEVHDSKIEAISSDAFNGLDQLEQVTFTNCEIGADPSAYSLDALRLALSDLTNLKKIEFWDSYCTNILFTQVLRKSTQRMKINCVK